MSTNADVRRNNLERLVLEFGTLERVAELGKTSPVYLSQVRAASKDHRGTARSMGTVVARKLEVGCDKPSGWIILNKPGPTAPGTTSPSYKSSAELIVTGCSADSYMSRGSIQFGGGSATGFATAIIPYGRPVLRSIKPLSLLAKIGRMACEEDADTNRSQKL